MLSLRYNWLWHASMKVMNGKIQFHMSHRRVLPEDEGFYYCEADNDNERLRSQPAYLLPAGTSMSSCKEFMHAYKSCTHEVNTYCSTQGWIDAVHKPQQEVTVGAGSSELDVWILSVMSLLTSGTTGAGKIKFSFSQICTWQTCSMYRVSQNSLYLGN